MSIGIENILDQAVSHAMQLGVFDSVNQHELTSKPGNGLVCAIWGQLGDPIQRRSGLDSTTMRIELTVRIYYPIASEPKDYIDPYMIKSADLLMEAYSGDFDLGGAVAEVDLLGAYGRGLGFTAGYVELAGAMMRVIDICLPLVAQDVWTQVR